MNLIFFILILTTPLCQSCTSSRHKNVRGLSNVVHSLPSLFSFDPNPILNSRSLCSSMGSSFDSCLVVQVHLDVLKKDKMTLPLDPFDESKQFLLKKVSQQGIELLDNEKAKGSTTINYKVFKYTVTFKDKHFLEKSVF